MLFTLKYDAEILSRINHFQNYPEMLPFIGSKWDISTIKILILGESHYIDKERLGDNFLKDWYNQNSDLLKEKYQTKNYLTNYIFTRAVIHKADKVKELGFANPLTIYYNIKNEIKNSILELSDKKYIFPYLSYYNYFQRPAFKQGDSIINDEKDDIVAYNTLVEMVKIIEPQKIIFVSKKAYCAFLFNKRKTSNVNIFDNKVYSLPHPATRWWNTKSAPYGNMKGREKFVEILKF